MKKSCAAACKFATGAATVDDATRPPSSKCPTTELNCSLFRALPANLDSIPEGCATFTAVTLPAVSENQYQVVTMVEETTAQDEQSFGLTSTLPTDCRNSLSERILTYTYGDSSNSMYLSVYKGTSATLPGVTFTIETYEADPDTGSGEADPDTGSGEADPDTGSGEVDPDTGSGEVDPDTKSGEVDPDTKSGKVDPDTKSGKVDPDTKSEGGLKAWQIVLIIIGSVIVVGGVGFLAYWQFCMRADQLKKDGGMKRLSPGGMVNSTVATQVGTGKQLFVNNQIVPVDHDGLELPKGESQAKDSVLAAKDGLAGGSQIPTGLE